MPLVQQYRPRPVVDPPKSDLKLLQLGQEVLTKTTGNPNFNPAPAALADLGTAVTNFATALNNAKSQKGTAAALAKARQDLIDALNHLADQVYAVTQKQPADAAKAMIGSAGLKIKTVTARAKPQLAVKRGSVSGVVVLIALAAARSAQYEYQSSSDGKTWADCATGWKAKATVSGLTPGQTYYFRFRAESRTGTTDWSQVVSIIVI